MKYRIQSIVLGGLGTILVPMLVIAFMMSTMMNASTTIERQHHDGGGGEETTFPNNIDAKLRLILVNSSVQMECPVKAPKLQDCEVGSCPQVYSASFPGSGSELFRIVVEAISGYTTNRIYNVTDLQQHFLVKTHVPFMSEWAIPLLVEPKHVIYLIRNPLWSLPSLFNWAYEHKNNIEDHSTQAPEKAWLRWRNQNFQNHFQYYKEHVDYWMNRYDEPKNLFVMPYERLVDQESGPLWTYSVGAFLESTASSVKIVKPDWIGCLWRKLVKEGKSKKRGAKKYRPNFTNQQLEVMEQSMQELQERHSQTFPVLGEALHSYMVEIQQRRAEE